MACLVGSHRKLRALHPGILSLADNSLVGELGLENDGLCILLVQECKLSLFFNYQVECFDSAINLKLVPSSLVSFCEWECVSPYFTESFCS